MVEHLHAFLERASAHVGTRQFPERKPELRDDPPGVGQFSDRAPAGRFPESPLADECIDQLDEILVAAGTFATA